MVGSVLPSVMRFHPLPHEFGLRTNVVPSFFSVGWVAGWEIGNAVNMKLRALKRGEIPVMSHVSVRTAFVDGSLVAIGGESKVSVARERRHLTDEVSQHDLLPIATYGVERTAEREGLAGALFFQILMGSEDPGSKAELLRNYFLYVAGLISERDFLRRLSRIRERELVGRMISEFI